MFFKLVEWLFNFILLTLFFPVSSRQIRPPIYSLKQSKLRRRRVIRYAILYFVMLAVFVALIVAPTLIGSKASGLSDTLNKQSFLKGLIQPSGLNNNDTRGFNVTGSGLVGGAGGAVSQTSAAASATDS